MVSLQLLADLITIKHGYALKGEFFRDAGEQIVLTPGNFHEEGGFRFRPGKEKFYAGPVPPDYVLNRGDVIVAMTEQGEGLLGSTAIVPQSDRFLHNQRLGLIRPKEGVELDLRFIYYLFNTRHVRQQIRATASGAKVRHTSPSRIGEVKAPIPSIDVQRRIASILSAYDDLIENNTRRIAILEEMSRRIYEEWFVRFRFPGHELDRPSWRNVQLGEIGIIQTGPFGSQLHQSDYVDDGVPVTMPKDIALNRIDVSSIARIPEQLADQLGRHRMRSGDIVYGRRGDIGRKAFIGARQEGWLCGTGCLLIRPNPEQVAPRFLFDALGAPETLGLIKGRAKGVTMPNLSGGLMQSVPLSLPPRELQDRYVMTVSPMVELLETLTERNRNLRATRDLLLPKLISGELDVSTLPEPEEAIAA